MASLIPFAPEVPSRSTNPFDNIPTAQALDVETFTRQKKQEIKNCMEECNRLKDELRQKKQEIKNCMEECNRLKDELSDLKNLCTLGGVCVWNRKWLGSHGTKTCGKCGRTEIEMFKGGRRRRKSKKKKTKRRRRRKKKKTKRKRKYRKQGGTKSSKRRAKMNINTEKRNRRTTAKDSSDRRWRERNDSNKTLRMLGNMNSTAGRDGDVFTRFSVEPHYLMSADERTALTKRMLYDKRFGQKGDNELVDKARVALPTIPQYQGVTQRNVLELIGCQGLNVYQDKEVRRLAARLYLAAYDDGDLGLTLNQPSTTLQQRQVILQPMHPNQGVTANGENLPFPLRIMRSSRRHHLTDHPGVPFNNNNRYPNANGVIDETHNMFWPTERRQIFDFMKTTPTLEEISFFGF